MTQSKSSTTILCPNAKSSSRLVVTVVHYDLKDQGTNLSYRSQVSFSH